MTETDTTRNERPERPWLFKPGNRGKPKGASNIKSESELFAIVVEEILDKMVGAALAGDVAAADVVLRHFRKTTKKEISK